MTSRKANRSPGHRQHHQGKQPETRSSNSPPRPQKQGKHRSAARHRTSSDPRQLPQLQVNDSLAMQYGTFSSNAPRRSQKQGNARSGAPAGDSPPDPPPQGSQQQANDRPATRRQQTHLPERWKPEREVPRLRRKAKRIPKTIEYSWKLVSGARERETPLRVKGEEDEDEDEDEAVNESEEMKMGRRLLDMGEEVLGTGKEMLSGADIRVEDGRVILGEGR